MTIGFSSPAYEVAEGEEVEVTVEMRGETDIDVIINVVSLDSTTNGELELILSILSVLSINFLSLLPPPRY